MNFQVLDKDGKPISTLGKVVPDRASVRVLVMDAAPTGPLHQPGSLPLTDADRDAREAAYLERKRRLSDAFRHPALAQPPAAARPPQTTLPAPVPGVSDAEVRYAERCAALERAYRRA